MEPERKDIEWNICYTKLVSMGIMLDSWNLIVVCKFFFRLTSSHEMILS